MNGAVGRARTLRRIRREREREAALAGVDVRDRPAFAAWERERSRSFYADLRARIAVTRPRTNRP